MYKNPDKVSESEKPLLGRGLGRPPKPNYWWSMFTFRCPRCRRGKMFNNNNAYRKLKLSHIFDMPQQCSVCKQKFEMEPGFWYGTGYVSYALAVAISGASFTAWIVLIGMGLQDNRWLYWLCSNALLLVILQPWLMRLSRVMYLYFFVKYDEEYETHDPKKFDY